MAGAARAPTESLVTDADAPAVLTTPWRGHGAAPTDRQLLAVGDVHGRAGALERLLRHLAALRLWGEGRDLVFLGDLLDRGPESLRAVRLAWEAGCLADRRLILPGNHELMLMDALAEGGTAGEPPTDSPAARLWQMNGGDAALREVDPAGRLAPAEALEAFAAALPEGFVAAMLSGPTHHKAGGLTFVHAGLDPRADRAAFLARPRERVAHDAHWAWIREPFLDWTGGWGPDGRGVVVHGHTPATFEPIRTPEEATPLLDRVATHGRLCLDAGAAAIDQVAAAEIAGDRYRLHVAPADAGVRSTPGAVHG